jgi:hypothetical protein
LATLSHAAALVDKDPKAIKNWLGIYSFAHMRGDVFFKVETGGKGQV